MKALMTLAAWSVIAGAILVAALSPQRGLMYQNPMACLSLGMIGLGLCLQARPRATAATAKA